MTGNEARTANQLRRLVASQEDDARLLGQFLANMDADAFAELVRRHGPMVLGVCRRVLGNEPDADDAFQATFLVLARRGRSVRDERSLASWLFGVARFAALRARDKIRRRREHEARASRELPTSTEADPELHAAVEEELQRLPDRYRAPLVVCILQGRTQEDAAREMGCSLSTLRRRLEQGQELLRRRLIGRGAVPTLGALAVTAGGTKVSATVIETTTALVVTVITGKAGVVPAIALAEGVMTMMARTKLKVSIAGLLVVASLTFGGVALQLATAQPPEPPPEAALRTNAKAPPAKNTEPPAKDKTPKKDTPAPADIIKPGDQLAIRADGDFEGAPISGLYEVEPSGKIALSPRYGGRLKIGGLTLEDAEQEITKQVRLYAPKCFITLVRPTSADSAVLEQRVKKLEEQVKQLQEIVDKLRKTLPPGQPGGR